MTVVPPIKSQGIRTKLVSLIRETVQQQECGCWIEPFMGTGVVAFNIQPQRAVMCDSNPHIIRFYKSVQRGKIDEGLARRYLEAEGNILMKTDGEHYYSVRERFNESGNPLDFLFLNRSCFNGMIRFNRKGGFNVPFCKKPRRFSKALVTRIVNQIAMVRRLMREGDYEFYNIDYTSAVAMANKDDIVYCDPPYLGRHVDYYDSWNETQEVELQRGLVKSESKYVVSTWLYNRFRVNLFAQQLWGDCYVSEKKHFYHLGAREKNRNEITEAVLCNFHVPGAVQLKKMRFEPVDEQYCSG